MFTILYYHTAIEFDDEDYTGLSRFLIIFIQVFRNSIGDIAVPQTKHFCQADDQCNYLSLVVMWILFFMNEFMVLIILLNFLIAVISSSHENVMAKKKEYMFRNIVSLNQ